MIKLKDFVTLIKPGLRLDLYVDDKMSLSCDVEDAVKTFTYDKRGELFVNQGSVSFYEQSVGHAGLYNKYVVVKCYTT